MWPILNAVHVPVFNRIDVNVINVILQVAFVPNDVFVKPALPNAAFTSRGPRSGKLPRRYQ